MVLLRRHREFFIAAVLRVGMIVCALLALVSLAHAKPISQILYEEQIKMECLGASAEEVNRLQICSLTSAPADIASDVDRATEFLFFKMAAESERERLNCVKFQLRQLRANKALLSDALKQSCRRLPAMKEAVGNKAFIAGWIESYSATNNRMVRNIPDKEFAENEKILAELRKHQSLYDELEATIRSSDVLLSSSHIYDALRYRLSDGKVQSGDSPEKACEFLESNVDKLLGKEAEEIETSLKLIDKKLASETEWLDDETFKRSLWRSASRTKILKQTKLDENSKGLVCRMEGRYGQGARTRDAVYNASTLALGGGMATVGRLAALAVWGSRAKTWLTVSRIAIGTEFASSTAVSVQHTLEACKDKLAAISDQETCEKLSDERFRSLYMKHTTANQCLLQAGISVVAGGLSGIGAVSVIKGGNANLAKELALRAERTRGATNGLGTGRMPAFTATVPDAKNLRGGALAEYNRSTSLWREYSQEFQAVTSKNIKDNQQLYIQAIEEGHPQIAFLKRVGYRFKVSADKKSLDVDVPPMEKLLQKYEGLVEANVASGRIQPEDVLVPMRAFKVNGRVEFFKYGELIPSNAVPYEKLLSGSEFERVIREGGFVIGESKMGSFGSTFHSPLEHDLGHLAAFAKFPEYQAELRRFNTTEFKGTLFSSSFELSMVRGRRSFYLNETLEGVTRENRGQLIEIFTRHNVVTPSMTKGVPVTVDEVQSQLSKLSDESVLALVREVKEKRHQLIQKAGGAQADLMDRQFTLNQVRTGGKYEVRKDAFLTGPDGRLDFFDLSVGSKVDRRQAAELIAALDNTSLMNFDEVVRAASQIRMDRKSPLYYLFCVNKVVMNNDMCK